MNYRTLTTLASGLALLIVASGMQTSTAQQPAFKRTILQKAGLSVPGREAVTALMGPEGEIGSRDESSA